MVLKRIGIALAACGVALAGFATVPAEASVQGSVPIVAPVRKQAARPPLPQKDDCHKKGAICTTAGLNFRYAGSWQFLGNTATPGSGGTQVAALVSQHPPYECVNPTTTPSCSTTQGGHTLWEISAENRSGSMVELGWTVDYALHGDFNTRLFCSAWSSGTWMGYSQSATSGYIDNPNESVGCGYNVSGVATKGTNLAVTAVGSTPVNFYQYRIERTGAPTWCPTCGPGWMVLQKNQGGVDRQLGIYRDSVFGAGAFSEIFLYQNFMETVAQNGSTDNQCHDGGSGTFAWGGVAPGTPNASAAEMLASSQNATGETNTPDGYDTPTTLGGTSSPTAYRIYNYPGSPYRFKFGGPGYNAAGTGTGVIGGC